MHIINKSYVTCLYTHYISLWIFTIRGLCVRDPYSMQARNIVAAFCHTQGCKGRTCESKGSNLRKSPPVAIFNSCK